MPRATPTEPAFTRERIREEPGGNERWPCRKRKARRVETAGLNQFSRGVSYEVRDWQDGTADPLTKAESWFSFFRSGIRTLESPGGRCSRVPTRSRTARWDRVRIGRVVAKLRSQHRKLHLARQCRGTPVVTSVDLNLSADTAPSVVAPVGSGCWIVGPIALAVV